MHIQLPTHPLYAYTGGKAFNPAQPTAVFIHGVLNDHSVWILQTRYLAHHGWNVLAIDLPGHCKSEGIPPQSVEEAADTVIALLNVLMIEKAALIGHSFGSLIALEATARDAAAHPGRINHLVMVGTAYPMRVSPALARTVDQRPVQGDRHGQQLFAFHTGPPTIGPRPRHLAVWRQQSAHAPCAGQQHAGQRVPHRLQGL